MKTITHVCPIGARSARDEAKVHIGRAVKSIAAQASAWIGACADYSTAAAVYNQLSKLSEAELRRRGLSRATLASDICKACDRATV